MFSMITRSIELKFSMSVYLVSMLKMCLALIAKKNLDKHASNSSSVIHWNYPQA